MQRAGHQRRGRRTVLSVWLLVATAALLGLGPRDGGAPGSGPVGAMQEVLRTQYHRLFNHLLGPVRVGIQIGHEGAQDHPEELAALRVSTGAQVGGISELDINRAVATALKQRLEAHGVTVDLLPATPPAGYAADLVISLHADSSKDPARRGYKSAHFAPDRNRFEPRLKTHLDAAYRSLLPDDGANISDSMRYYYAFNFRRYRHSIHPGTPAVLVELGYISNPQDLRFLQGEAPAAALAEGILGYLRERGRLPGVNAPDR